MNDPIWQYADAENTIVWRDWPDGRGESALVSTPGKKFKLGSLKATRLTHMSRHHLLTRANNRREAGDCRADD